MVREPGSNRVGNKRNASTKANVSEMYALKLAHLRF